MQDTSLSLVSICDAWHLLLLSDARTFLTNWRYSIYATLVEIIVIIIGILGNRKFNV